jgi:hypothetical protein
MFEFKVSDYLEERNRSLGKCKVCGKNVSWSRDRVAAHKRNNCDETNDQTKRKFAKVSTKYLGDAGSFSSKFGEANSEAFIRVETKSNERDSTKKKDAPASKPSKLSKFRVCRICLKSDSESELCSLFHGNGKKVEMFEQISGIDVRENSSHQLPLSSFTVSDFIGQKQQV